MSGPRSIRAGAAGAALLALAAVPAARAQSPAHAPRRDPAHPVAMPVSARRPSAAPVAVLRDSMRAVLDRALADSAFPGAFAVVGSRRGVLVQMGVGHTDWAPSPQPDENTMWDLASLTKVIGMTTAMQQLVLAGKVNLDAPVQRYLPDWKDPDSVQVTDSAGVRHWVPWRGPSKATVTVRHLLTHSSGLPAWRPLYKEATSPEDALRLVYETPLDTVPGARYVYSDLGAILLGQIVEHVSGQPLDVYLYEHVFGPLQMWSTMYRPSPWMRFRIAPTEFDPWRQRHIWGEVHDENAYALGGVSGHAGLFSTGHDLARFARMYLNGGKLDGAAITTPGMIRTFTTVQDSAFSQRALGWETPNGTNSAGHRLSSHAFGHTGFTGTSIWIDPANDVFIILLTNRVNPTRMNTKVYHVRTQLADAVMAALHPEAAAAAGRRR